MYSVLRGVRGDHLYRLWSDWGDTSPAEVIACLSEAAQVSSRAARFVVNTTRVALGLRLADIVASTRLRSLAPSWWVKMLRPPYFFLDAALGRILQPVCRQHWATSRRRPKTLQDIAQAVECVGLPVAPLSSPTILKRGWEYGGLVCGGQTLLLQIGHRDELSRTTLRHLLWGDDDQVAAECLDCVLEALEVVEQVPMGLLRPDDLLGMDDEDAWDFLQYACAYLRDHCRCASGLHAPPPAWQLNSLRLETTSERPFEYTVARLAYDSILALRATAVGLP